MRTVCRLLKHEGRVYVYLRGANLGRLFLKQAEEEGFTFGDGARPTEREWDSVFALNRDWSISYVGYAGRVAFRCAKAVGGEKLVRVDYGQYLCGAKDYLMRADREKD